MKAIITVIGEDKVGIIAGVSSVLSECSVNILDITQTVMQEYFTMIMMVDLSAMNISFGELKEKLDKKGESLSVAIRVQHKDIFKSMHTI